MTVDRSKLAFYGGDSIDEIIGVFTGSMSVGAPTSSQGSLSVTKSHAHGFGDSAYFQGIFSTDGGTTWNDFGAQTPYLGGTYPAFQTAECNAVVDTTNLKVTGTSWYDYGNSRSVAYTITYKVFLLAKNTMAKPITPLPASNALFLTSKYNYQKIAFQGTKLLSVASGSSGSVTITHNLGYVPKVRAWWFDNASPSTCQPITTDLSASTQVKVSTTTLVFYSDQTGLSGGTVKGNVEYRIYYD